MLNASALTLSISAALSSSVDSDNADLMLVGTASNFVPVLEHVNASTLASISANSTGQLLVQAIKGAPFDAVIVASTKAKQQLLSALPDASAYKLASGQLALACVNTQLVKSPASASISIANPLTAPFGRAASQWLAINDIKPQRLIRSRSASQAFSYLSGGQVDCTITSASWVVGRWPTDQWRKLSLPTDDLDQWLISIRPHANLKPLLLNIYGADLGLLGYDGAHD